MSKVQLLPGTGIAIQGPTYMMEQMCYFWKQFDCPIVWATWEDEPAKNVLFIERQGIEVVLVDKPKYDGYLNCNLQFKSSFAALTRLKELGVTHALKNRHDCVIWGLEKLWSSTDWDISFMHSYNPQNCPDTAYRLPKYLEYPNSEGKFHLGLDFPLDFSIFGKIDTLIKVFDLYIGHNLSIPPESLILKKWLDLNGLEDDFSPDYLKSNGLHYWGPDAIEKDASLIWLKEGWNITILLKFESGKRIY